ncbi:HlyD family secretion protein [Agaribacter flavus]|uniref:HlyD family secretion protein n=1 Tax=Agaribacter flavus TaxID=1902781 RepID=A0ABV7FYM2_9ALTE
MFKPPSSKKAIVCMFVALFLLGCAERGAENVIERDLTPAVSAPAELVSLQEISISPPNIPRTWEYKIEYLARENSFVQAGDLLVKFDGQRLTTELLERQSQLGAEKKEAERISLENKAKLEQLTLDLAEAKKNREIAKRKVEITDVSRSEIERKKQQAEYKITTELYTQAKQRIKQHHTAMQVSEQVQGAKVEKAKFRVRQIEDSIKKLTINAPSSGMVTLIPNSDDDKPAVGDTVFMGLRIISLPSLEKIAVKVEFDESVTSQVTLGEEVRVTLDAYPEKPFSGTISELGQSYRYKSKNNMKIVFDAWVTLDTLDLDIMRPGMKATVELRGEQS